METSFRFAILAHGTSVARHHPGPITFAKEDIGVNNGDTAWLLVSAALVMLMTPGLALFYGGMVRRKNVLGTIMQVVHRHRA